MKEKKKKSYKKREVLILSSLTENREAEISEAQAQDGELILDADLNELAEKVAEEGDKFEREMADIVKKAAENKKDTQDELAQQIAEDIAVEEENKRNSRAKDLEIINKDPEVMAAMPTQDESGNLDLKELESCIEALLFVSEGPLSAKKLKEFLAPEYNTKLFKNAMKELQNKYEAVQFGIEVVEVNGGYQFRTKPGRAALAKKLAKVSSHRLSRGAMETLAIIAYKQPVLKDDIDKIRGVDSSHFLRTLMEKKLVEMSGRSELPGRPIIYTTSSVFLEIFGIADIQALPPLKELESMIPASQSDNPEDEDPKVRKLRELVNQMNNETDRIQYDAGQDHAFLDGIRNRVKDISISTPSLDAQNNPPEALVAPSAAPGETQFLFDQKSQHIPTEPVVEATPSEAL